MKTSKFSSRFDHIITASDILKSGGLNISEASQKELGRYLPYEIDYSNGSDLVGLAFDIALVNMFNSNGDGVCSRGAVKLMRTARHKPLNVEHDRSSIVGHILEASLTDTVFKKSLHPEDVEGRMVPFNITLGAVLYKIAAKGLADLILSIQKDENAADFSVCASWEVGFDNYFAAIGSNRLSECEIITDQKRVKELAPFMKAFGGKGVGPDGKIVNRLFDPDSDMVFLGGGLTKYPAADVQPVYIFDYSQTNSEISVPAISHLKNKDVIPVRSEQTMKPEEIQALVNEAVASSLKDSKMSEESIASTTEKIANAIVESNKAFVAEKEAAEAKAAQIEATANEQKEKIASLEAKAEEISKELSASNEKIAEFEKAAKAASDKQKFDERMSAIDEEFALEDSDRAILVKRLSSFSSDEQFEEFRQELDVLMASKKKSVVEANKAKQENEVKEALAAELQKRGIGDPLENKAPEADVIPNNSAEGSEKIEGLEKRFSSAFKKETIKVTL